jgi:hypothetical protein
LITTPEPLRSELRPLTRARLLQRLAATRPHSRADAELRLSLLALRSIARRVLALTAAERELAREIETITRKLAPQLFGGVAVKRLRESFNGRERRERRVDRLVERGAGSESVLGPQLEDERLLGLSEFPVDACEFAHPFGLGHSEMSRAPWRRPRLAQRLLRRPR